LRPLARCGPEPVIDPDGKVIEAPQEGILLTKRLAGQLGVEPGDGDRRRVSDRPARASPTHGERHRHAVFRHGAYMNADYAARLFRLSPRISIANVLVDDNRTRRPAPQAEGHTQLSGLIMLTGTRRFLSRYDQGKHRDPVD
jgi:putative ABC transport system permease protein